MNGNRILFRKEVSKANGGKMESCGRIKDRNEMLVLGEVKMRKIWKEYFKDFLI